MIRNNTLFKIFAIIGFATFMIIWEVSLLNWADTIAIYFWIAIVFGVLVGLSQNGSIKIPDSKKHLTKMENKNEIERQNIRKKIDEEAEIARQIDCKKQPFIDSYGDLSKEIKLDRYCNPHYNSELVENKILIFEDSSKIIIQGKIFKFIDIIAFELKDDEQIIYQSSVSTSTSSTSTGSLVGRAIVGGVLLGGVGAIVGGVTAKKDIITTNTPQQTIVTHNYKVHIIVNSISEPQIILNLGKHGTEPTNELVAVLLVILERNKEKRNYSAEKQNNRN